MGMLNQSTDTLNQLSNTIQNQKDLANQYTGNAGYENALKQAYKGAQTTANQAGAAARTSARNSGMSKAQAAAMGANQAANAYGNNFNTQQSMANTAGMNALQANQAVGNMQNALYGNQFNRGQYGMNMLGSGLQAAGNVITGFTGLSDERCKDLEDKANGLSKLLEPIDAYIYKYKESAQEKYPNEADDNTHVGPMAQDLQKNPVTAGAVEPDKDGTLHVNGTQLALQAIAAIADLSKRVSEMENE